MGAPLTEFVLETVIRDGLGDLRANPTKIDDIFSRFLEAQFLNQYGQAKIDQIKQYITGQTKQIKIVHAWSQVPTHVPCFSIQLLSSDEEEGLQNLGNEFPEQETPKEPTVYVAVATPTAYDLVYGKLSFDSSTDLSTVCAGMLFVDADDVSFPISAPMSNLSGNKYVTLPRDGNAPNLTAPGKIVSSIDFTRHDFKLVRLRERIALGVHASNDVHLTKFLYYILQWILKSRQESLINRGITLDRGTGQMMDRDDSFEGENVYSRIMQVTCISNFTWNQATVQVFDCFDLTLKTNTPSPNSTAAAPYNPDES